jgi:hypothetical protein
MEHYLRVSYAPSRSSVWIWVLRITIAYLHSSVEYVMRCYLVIIINITIKTCQSATLAEVNQSTGRSVNQSVNESDSQSGERSVMLKSYHEEIAGSECKNFMSSVKYFPREK